MGMIEDPRFSVGTTKLISALGVLRQKGINVIACGGDTVFAIERAHKEQCFTHISTSGGAALELLSGKQMPGIECLRKT
jgi:phosphoglycerate kinase